MFRSIFRSVLVVASIAGCLALGACGGASYYRPTGAYYYGAQQQTGYYAQPTGYYAQPTGYYYGGYATTYVAQQPAVVYRPGVTVVAPAAPAYYAQPGAFVGVGRRGRGWWR